MDGEEVFNQRETDFPNLVTLNNYSHFNDLTVTCKYQA